MNLMTKLCVLLSKLVTTVKADAFTDTQKNQHTHPIGKCRFFMPKSLRPFARASVSFLVAHGDLSLHI